jgi:lipopolysaccharide assembly outer membrane protein LptD (OstA)
MTLHADRVVFDSKKSRLVADGDVIFEDGIRVRRTKRVELDLLAGTASIGQTTLKP